MDHHQYLLQVASVPNITWPDRVGMVTRQYNVDAAQAAQMLEPYYKKSEYLRWSAQYLSNSLVTGFLKQVKALVNKGDISWSDGVGHVARQLNIPADKAAMLLSDVE